MKYKIMFWGLGKEFQKIQFAYYEEEKKGNIEIIGAIDKTGGNRFSCGSHHFPIFFSKEAPISCADYVIITSPSCIDEIYSDLRRLNVDESKIVDGRIIYVPGFDFDLFVKEGRICDRVFDDVLKDITYSERNRGYVSGKLRITLGHKSYMGLTTFQHAPSFYESSNIIIGNYTCMSDNICFRLGMNLDHDYHRVMNYGITHLDAGSQKLFKINRNKQNRVIVGSDVWIGMGTTISGDIEIGNGAVVASDSVVVKDIPPFAIAGGNPARIIKYRFDHDVIGKLLKISWWNWSVEEIKQNMKYFNNPIEFVNKFYKNNPI